MSKVFADKIEPRDSSMDVTIGTSTNTVTLAGNDLRANTVKDSGGNTLWTSDGSGNLSSVNSALAGNLILLSTQTASAASSVSFTSDIDDTYDVYVFKFIDLNPATDNACIKFNGSTDSGSTYNVTKTTTYFKATHDEADTGTNVYYVPSWDLAQSTADQGINVGIGSGSDESSAGELYLFNPASTTYIKHFYSRTMTLYAYDYATDAFVGGYFNTTSAIDAVRFIPSSGNFDGIIKMYGLL